MQSATTSDMEFGEGSVPHTASVTLQVFAKERGLPLDWLVSAGVDLCPAGGERPGWIRIPYRNMRGVWGYRYRNPKPSDKRDRYWNPSGSGTHLYNPFGAGPGSSEVWIAEGELDTLVLSGLGKDAVGIPGTGNTDMFHRTWVHLFEGATIYIATDGDEEGRKAAHRLKDGFDKSGLRASIVPVPTDRDINDWWIEDPEGLRKVLNQGGNT